MQASQRVDRLHAAVQLNSGPSGILQLLLCGFAAIKHHGRPAANADALQASLTQTIRCVNGRISDYINVYSLHESGNVNYSCLID